MRLILSTFSLVLSIVAFNAHAITLNCRFLEEHYFYGHGRDYACDVESISITSFDDRAISGISGVHKRGKGNDDVKLIAIFEKTLHYFPRDVHKFFKNIEMIAVFHSKLKEIHREDLESFHKLQILWMENGELEALESGIFDGNPDLEFIAISSNKIKHVDSGVFSNLNKLNKLFFEFNSCFSKLAWDREAVLSSINEIESKCKDASTLQLHLQEAKIQLIECQSKLTDDELLDDAEVTETVVERLIEGIKTTKERAENCERVRKEHFEDSSSAGGRIEANFAVIFSFLLIFKF